MKKPPFTMEFPDPHFSTVKLIRRSPLALPLREVSRGILIIIINTSCVACEAGFVCVASVLNVCGCVCVRLLAPMLSVSIPVG